MFGTDTVDAFSATACADTLDQVSTKNDVELQRVEQKAEADVAPTEVPLPKGWKTALDKNSGRTYYYNKATKDRRWKRPTEEDAND